MKYFAQKEERNRKKHIMLLDEMNSLINFTISLTLKKIPASSRASASSLLALNLPPVAFERRGPLECSIHIKLMIEVGVCLTRGKATSSELTVSSLPASFPPASFPVSSSSAHSPPQFSVYVWAVFSASTRS